MDTPPRNRLPLSRPLPDGCRPRTLPLRLADGCQTEVHAYEPAGGAGPAVVYLHGIQSHPGWFCGSAAALAAAGCAVYMPVRRGSGAAKIDRGHARSARQLLDDLSAAGRLAMERTGSSAVHLLGVSWGGKLAAAYAAQRRPDVPVASLALVAPGLASRVDVPATTKLGIAAAALLRPRRLFDIPLSDVELFTDNPAMQAYLRADSLRLQRASGRFLLVSRLLDAAIGRLGRGSIACPTLLLLAEGDRIIDNAAARRIVERLTAGRAEVRTLQGAHTLEFEADPSPLTEALVDWLRRTGRDSRPPAAAARD